MRSDKQLTEFGQWLMPRLRSRNLNREQFAKLCGVGSSVVAKWLFANRPSAGSCELIANALGIDVGIVLAEAGYPVGRTNLDMDELRSEALALIQAMPDSLLLPYVIGMRAIVGHSHPQELLEQLKSMLDQEEND